jgi:hypothetical protein
MDNAETKLEFQKDCTEIIANIMGLFYIKKKEKILLLKQTDINKMTAKERREYQRSLWNQRNKQS